MSENIPKIFIAYSHKDKSHLEELRVTLSPLIRNNKVKIWFDGEIKPGDIWDEEIKREIHSADIILLLLSTYSLNSDYFYEKEVNDALSRHNNGRARVIPILVSPCLWDETPLKTLQVLPNGAKPISEWSNSSSAWNDVAKGIRLAIDESQAKLKKLVVEKIEEEKKREKERKDQEMKQKIEKEKKEKENRFSIFTEQIAKSNKLIAEKQWGEAEGLLRDTLLKWELGFVPDKEKIISNISKCISGQISADSQQEGRFNISNFTSFVKKKIESIFFKFKKMNRQKVLILFIALISFFYSATISIIYLDLKSSDAILSNKTLNISRNLDNFVECYPVIIKKINIQFEEGQHFDSIQYRKDIYLDSIRYKKEQYLDSIRHKYTRKKENKSKSYVVKTPINKNEYYTNKLTITPTIEFQSTKNQTLDIEVRVYNEYNTLLIGIDKNRDHSVLCPKIKFNSAISGEVALCSFQFDRYSSYYRVEIWYNHRCLGYEVFETKNSKDKPKNVKKKPKIE